ncbi:hypothetical protein QQP08_009822 [Theobroma cacao]|nr:hypothetical protein QQP08_009822 [Theobroma cacao]
MTFTTLPLYPPSFIRFLSSSGYPLPFFCLVFTLNNPKSSATKTHALINSFSLRDENPYHATMS